MKKECILSQYFIVRKLVWTHILWVNVAFFARIYTAEFKHSILSVNMIIILPTDFLLALVFVAKNCETLLTPTYRHLWRQDYSTVNITVEEFCQHRKKKKSCPWLLNNCSSHCWMIMPVTVEQSCQIVPVTNEESYQWLLNNGVPVTVEQSCQSLMKNHTSDCWTIVPVTVEQSCQPLLNNHASDCWTIVPVTVNQSCQWLLNNRASDCWTIVP